MEIPLSLRAEEYQNEKVPRNVEIHGFVVNDLYYCSDNNSVIDVSGYNYYKFADYWFYLHTIDISFTDYDGFNPDLNGATIVLQEKETQKKIVLQENYLDGQFVQFQCSTGQYIIEVQKGGIAYIHNLNLSKNEKMFLALSADDYYYLSPNEKDSYINLEANDRESKQKSDKSILQPEIETIPETVLSTIYDDVQLLIDDGKYIEAADLYKSKISDPTPEDWCNVGDILNYYIGDYDQALLYYSICLQNDPTNEKAMKGFEYAYEHGGDITENDLNNEDTDLYSNEDSYIGNNLENNLEEVDNRDEEIKDIDMKKNSLTTLDLTGMDEVTAISTCTQNGYKYSIEYYLGGNGTVISQSPTSSERIEADGSTIINIGISQNDFSNRLLALINEKRRAAGLGELSFSEQLNTACNILAQENVNSVDCIRPNGSHWSSVLGENGILLSDGIFTTRNNITSLSNANGRIKYAGNSYGDGNLLTSSYTIIGMAYSSNNMLVIIVGG